MEEALLTANETTESYEIEECEIEGCEECDTVIFTLSSVMSIDAAGWLSLTLLRPDCFVSWGARVAFYATTCCVCGFVCWFFGRSVPIFVRESSFSKLACWVLCVFAVVYVFLMNDVRRVRDLIDEC